jgi:mRNA-degrading endonuclease RelE of RelBE toxin-antitoxin system
MPGAATQIFSAEFDSALARLPGSIATLVAGKIDDMGGRLDSFPHYRMTGRNEFRLRVGDYRIIYEFNVARTKYPSSRSATGARYIAEDVHSRRRTIPPVARHPRSATFDIPSPNP